jgi:transposase
LTRINWDAEGNWQLRERIADSWVHQKDLYKDGECLDKFATHVDIDRNVLRRFLKHKHGKEQTVTRGQPVFFKLRHTTFV